MVNHIKEGSIPEYNPLENSIPESNMSSNMNDVQVCNESDDHYRVSTSIDAETDMIFRSCPFYA